MRLAAEALTKVDVARHLRAQHFYSRLNHPNIVSVFDTGEKNVTGLTIPYIVMD